MKQYLPVFSRCPLFSRIGNDDLLLMLTCLRAQAVHFNEGSTILRQGEPAVSFGVVLSGRVNVLSCDASGNHTLLASPGPAELFAETFACAEVNAMPVSVTAAQDCTVLLLDRARVMTGCRNGCMMHSFLITNLMSLLAHKNIQLQQKIGIISQRTTRDRLIAYLHMQQKQAGSTRFTIPFDRQELADFLCVERSALSAEIGRLKREGIIDCRKSEFVLLAPAQRDTHTPETASL